MKLELDSACARFVHDGRSVGDYVLDDTYKPHFRSLLTPAGHQTVVVSPGDHRHHKGLMYALRCKDLNFWEETPGWQCGVQRILSTKALPSATGLIQDILWCGENNDLATYRETRTLQARFAPAAAAFIYTWRTQRTALRDHTLIKSPWSFKHPDGRTINYHGLGIRLPWMWRFPFHQYGGVEQDGHPADPVATCGTTAPSVGFWGLIDGQWQRSVAAVTFRQVAPQTFTWFVLKTDFAYLSLGPTNADGLSVTSGQTFDETYAVEVADRTATFGLPLNKS
ncbi:MAG: PmoA family protein [Cephaloticoccus sp.]|nr:PmoA family protein [Cephaloticoccus sp.]